MHKARRATPSQPTIFRANGHMVCHAIYLSTQIWNTNQETTAGRRVEEIYWQDSLLHALDLVLSCTVLELDAKSLRGRIATGGATVVHAFSWGSANYLHKPGSSRPPTSPIICSLHACLRHLLIITWPVATLPRATSVSASWDVQCSCSIVL